MQVSALIGGGAITVAELIRSPRDQAERPLHTYRESMSASASWWSLSCMTVVRDLTRAS